jgi:dTMP kinase
MPPLFIVFEGIEGSGKSTQAALLSEHLTSRGIPCILTREPGGTPTGEEIREVLLHGCDIAPATELLLMCAARAAHVAEVILPALQAGSVVISDRYELSTFAYQGAGRGLDMADVRYVNRVATGGLEPDATIVVDVPWEVGAARREGRGADRIERAGDVFHLRVAEAYRLLSEESDTVVRVDGVGSPDEVHGRVLALLRRRFPETFASDKG